jgi:hypothetical protein
MAEIESAIHSITSGIHAADLFALALVSLSSRIKPLLEMRLEALEHIFFNVFDVGEPIPTSDIAVFTGTLKLQNEFFH